MLQALLAILTRTAVVPDIPGLLLGIDALFSTAQLMIAALTTVTHQELPASAATAL